MKPGKLAALGEHNGELCVWIEDDPHLSMSANNWRGGDANMASAAPIFEWMQMWNIGVLHVHASALPLLGLPDELPVPRRGERRPPHPFVEQVRVDGKLVSSRGLAPSITAGSMELVIGAYQDGAGDPFEDATNAHELLCAHRTLTAALDGWQWRNSAAVTGWKLMHAPWLHGRRAARLAAVEDWPAKELPPFHEGRQWEVPYGSWAALRSRPIPWGFVTAWDVNGQRLAACARLPLGLGGLKRLRAGTTMLNLPGYHRVTSVDSWPELIPSVFEPGWHTTDRVKMAHYCGMKPIIAESWVWSEHAPYLDPWYERLRDARAELAGTTEAAGELAAGALKQLYLQPLGRLRSRKARERGDLYYRPDWYDAVIGQELAREYLRLHQLAQAVTSGVRVLGVYYDTIILEHELLTPPPILPVSDQLGKYKQLGWCPADAAHETLYGGDRPNVTALVSLLKQSAPPTGENPHPSGGGASVGHSPQSPALDGERSNAAR